MKRYVFLFLFLCLGLVLQAQSYATLWKNVQHASDVDKPRTALRYIRIIEQKALAEHNEAQILRAQLMVARYGGEISVDSLEQNLCVMQQKLASEKRPVVKALWHSALAQVYQSFLYRSDELGLTSQEVKQRIAQHYQASLADPNLLVQTCAHEWLPVLKQGERSQYFANDLYHVLLYSCLNRQNQTIEEKNKYYTQAIQLYQKQGLRSAVLLLQLDSIRNIVQTEFVNGRLENDATFKCLQQLLVAYKDEPANIYTYEALLDFQNQTAERNSVSTHNDSLLIAYAKQGIAFYGKGKSANQANRLRNFVKRLENPGAQLTGMSDTYYPADTAQFTLSARNMKQVQVRVTLINPSALAYNQKKYPNAVKLFAKLPASQQSKAQIYTISFDVQDKYVWNQKEVDFGVPSNPGVYLVELICDGMTYDAQVMYVSAIRPLVFFSQSGAYRLAVLDSRSGKPLPGAKVVGCHSKTHVQVKTYHTDQRGFLDLSSSEFQSAEERVYYVSYGQDLAAQQVTLSHWRYTPGKISLTDNHVELFADRAIYRPGQQVSFTGVAYTRNGDNFAVLKDREFELTLYNVNHKKVDSLQLRTDAWGSFKGEFNLPKSGMTGYYNITAQALGMSEILYFKVEEYKRPTLVLETQPIQVAYQLGDSVNVEGILHTYSGVPVGNARVTYEVQRSAWYRWDDDDFKVQRGEVITDAKGRFKMPVWLAVSSEAIHSKRLNHYYYTINYTATAETGESVNSSLTLHAATVPAWYDVSIPSAMCKEELLPFSISLYNTANQLLENNLEVRILREQKEVWCETLPNGKAFQIDDLAQMPSGVYTLELPAIAGAAPYKQQFVLFSVTDSIPANPAEPLFFYEHKPDTAGTIRVLVGSPEHGAYLFYDLWVGSKVVESRTYELNNQLVLLERSYLPSYGEGALMRLCMVRNGKLYQREVKLAKPVLDKRLLLKWRTFRSRLTPGQHEEWSFTVQHPDGRPADARVMARMYDASLLAFAQDSWNFKNLGISRYLPYAYCQWKESSSYLGISLYANKLYNRLDEHQAYCTTWDTSLFGCKVYDFATLEQSCSRTMRKSNVAMPLSGKFKEMSVAEDRLNETTVNHTVKNSGVKFNQADTPSLRNNFVETAFFRPSMQTDADGQVSIAFVLPESMTQWHFTALAYDHAMNYGSMDTLVVAQKEFMVEPALPRFVRQGDCTVFPVKVTNLTDHTLKATLQLHLEDALDKALKPLWKTQREISVEAGKTIVYYFDYQVKNDSPLLMFKVVAEADDYSDGEEHLLPVLSDKVEVTRTLPFSMYDKGIYTFAIDTLFSLHGATERSLTVELTSNPTWSVVSALPVLVGTGHCISAFDWATRFYALALGKRLAEINPELQRMVKHNAEEYDQLVRLQTQGLTDDTPWMRQADLQRQRATGLRHLFDEEWVALNRSTAIDKLAALQHTDGSWSWYPGMSGNTFITVDVAILLARVQRLAEDYGTKSQLQRALDYLRKEIARDVQAMKKAERNKQVVVPVEWHLRYLYLLSVCGQPADADAKYLLNRAAKLNAELTMYGKAIGAVVLAEYGYDSEARLIMESLLEHTVATPGMGRWFDTPRAEWSWSSYRIPTQCAAIEALAYFGREIEADAMRMWLLQARRTQMWQTNRTTADAVYALLSTAGKSYAVNALAEHTPVYYTLSKNKKLVGINARTTSLTPTTTGYYCDTYKDRQAVEATVLKVDKQTQGLSWGSVSATCYLPSSEVKTAGKGLTMHAHWEYFTPTGWEELQYKDVLSKGDTVRQVFVIKADRDYDFVCLESARAACLEPVEPLSGYIWNNGFSAYRSVHDSRTAYFVEKVHKGTHVLTEEYRVDRTGNYTTGISSVKSVYAPEFRATVHETQLKVE